MTSHALHVKHKVLNQNFFVEPRLCLLRPETLNPQIHPRFWIAGVADLASAAECDHLGGANTSLSPRAMQLLQVEEHDRISLKIAKPPIPTRFLLRKDAISDGDFPFACVSPSSPGSPGPWSMQPQLQQVSCSCE